MTDHLLDFSWNRLADIITQLNYCRENFINYDPEEEKIRHPEMQYEKKDYWWQMIQLLPSSYNQTRNVMTNYEVLANIYKSRKNHKLDEWREFCKWIEELPYSELITSPYKKEGGLIFMAARDQYDKDILKALRSIATSLKHIEKYYSSLTISTYENDISEECTEEEVKNNEK